ncbi:MAG: metallophosphoesterase [Lentisphaeria bacterium]|nr:metallophosphoesterase [Lentisphaeria bacterium]
MMTFHSTTEAPLARFGVLADPQYTDSEPSIGRNYREGKNIIAKTLEVFNREKRLDFVCNLGDVVDGRVKSELPDVLEVFQKSLFPVKHTLGNHDLCLQSAQDLQEAYAMTDFNEEFEIGGIRFVLLNTMEISVLHPKEMKEYSVAKEYMDSHAERNLRYYNGMMSTESLNWFERLLTDADKKDETVVVLTHSPICATAASESTVTWNADEMLEMTDRHHSLRAWIAGHHHKGGLAERKHVLHKTVMGLCEMPEATGCIVSLYNDRMEIEGFGKETNHVFRY